MTKETDQKKYTKLAICVNWRAGNMLPSCGNVGSRELVSALETGLEEQKIDLQLQKLHCMGKCHLGPTMRLVPAGPFIMGAKEEDAAHILQLLKEEKFDQLAKEFPLKD